MRTGAVVLLSLLVTVGPAAADLDLVAKREACQTEARSRVKPRGRASGEFAKALIERRMELVRACMERPAVASKTKPVTTGSVKR
jgi:hypothetical protein